jgi:heat shock protein HslJ
VEKAKTEGVKMENTNTIKKSIHARIKFWEVLALVMILGLTAVACVSPANADAQLEGVTWVLKSYGDTANPTAAVSGHEPTLTFDADKKTVSGNTGVNGYGGDYTLEGSKLTFGPLMQTMMASTDPALNAQETAYTKILGSAQNYKINNGQLTITGTEGVLVFVQK